MTQTGYQQNFQDISMQIMDCKTLDDWRKVYRRLVHWELELSNTGSSMADILVTQKEEANNGFAKYVKANYMDWVAEGASTSNGRPVMRPDLFKSTIFPLLDKGEKVFLIVLG